MAHTLDSFASTCHEILKSEPGPEGRAKVASALEDALKDDVFVAAHLLDGGPERKVLYEDPEMGFCILAHVYEGARESSPHDHGPSWAIYGQAKGETIMTEWEVVDPATPEKPGKVRGVRVYALKPGMAQVYNEGQLHSPKREGPTRLIRIEGRNMDGVARLAYRPE